MRLDLHMIANLAKQAEAGDKAAKASLRAISEHDFSVAICRFAEAMRWTVWYTRRSGAIGTDGKWRGSGPQGEPDLRLVRARFSALYNTSHYSDLPRDVIFAELKTEAGRPTDAQQDALATLGQYGRLWRPRDAHRIIEELGDEPRARERNDA